MWLIYLKCVSNCCNFTSLPSDHLIEDPVSVVWHPGVDSWVACPTSSGSPWHQPDQRERINGVFPSDERTATVSTAAVLSWHSSSTEMCLNRYIEHISTFGLKMLTPYIFAWKICLVRKIEENISLFENRSFKSLFDFKIYPMKSMKKMQL